MHALARQRRICIALLLAASCARAQDDGQRVHRCVGLHGEVVFSGLACNANESAGMSAGAVASMSAPPPADSCPASRQELRDRLASAVTRHDANTIAGMLHWQGIGGGAASERLRALRNLVRYPLLALETGDGDSDGLHVRTGSNTTGGVQEQSFGVGYAGGCYWLDW